MALLGITRIFQPVSSWASRSFSRASKIKDKPKANKSEKVSPKGSKAKRRKFFGSFRVIHQILPCNQPGILQFPDQ